ncbi:MAG: B12-binding domain-containing radical SAM protein [Desulfosalsimonadaceae bacterium]
MLLLIHPPVVKPGEPPAGPARLAYALKSRGAGCRVWDANLEGLLDLLERPAGASDTWSRRAAAGLRENLAALRTPRICSNFERYKQAVLDVNRLLCMAGARAGCRISLSDYTDPLLSPVRSRDLLDASRRFAENPFFPFFQKRLPGLLKESRPRLIGLSINFMSQALCGFAMAGFIRAIRPDIPIVCGGGLITSWMSMPGFSNPFFPLLDDLAAGPGEETLLSMMGKDGSGMLDEAGMDYADFDLDSYLSPARVMPYTAARGCYWQKCRFCPEKFENSSYRPFDKEDLCTAAARDAAETGAQLIHFTDNAIPPAFLRRLIRCPPGAAWYGFVRVTPHLTDPDFVRGLKASGCVMLKLGVESGDQQVLDALNKGVRVETVSRALQTIHAAGIGVYAYLLFGTPAETPASARKTLSFTLAHAECIDFLNLAVFNLPALSGDGRGLETADFYPGDLSLYRDFVHPEGWHRRRVRRFLEKEFKQPAAIRAIIREDPPFFTSNHAPFIVNTGLFR